MHDPFPDPDDLLPDIGDRIRCERRARGWSQAVLATSLGHERHHVRRLEAGLDSISAYAAACRAMGLTLDYLLSARWVMPEQQKPLTPRQVSVLAAVRGGGTLADAARRLGTTRQVVGARLSEAYRVLGVEALPVGDRRPAAVRMAEQQGLFVDAA